MAIMGGGKALIGDKNGHREFSFAGVAIGARTGLPLMK
jgi:hypothetical protein